jgi:hypothetical protein
MQDLDSGMPRQADIEREPFDLLLNSDFFSYFKSSTNPVLHSYLTPDFPRHFKSSRQFWFTFTHHIFFINIHHALQAQQPPPLFERWGPRPESRALHQEDASKHLERCF